MLRDWFAVPYTRGDGAQVLFEQDLDFPHYQAFNEDLKDLPFVYVKGDFTQESLELWWRSISEEGCLVLRCSSPPEAVCAVMESVGCWDLVALDEDNESVCLIFKKKAEGHTLSCRSSVKPLKTACVVRFGGFGDMIQASCLFPQLKAQGYEVTVMTTDKGKNMLKHDPYVDKFFIQDDDQVPNPELGPYWDFWRSKYDRLINLSMSIEGACLVIPDDFRTHWTKQAIHRFCNHNYLEVQSEIADVPLNAKAAKFYPSQSEKDWAKKELDPIRDKQIILWSLSGSSLHKCSPYTDNVIARVLSTYPDAHFILVGDNACQLLEHGWENEKRIWCKSGKYSIRETLTLAQNVDLVMGPETGVLNSVAMEKVYKVIMLSHSSKENLTKHWVNTNSLVPVKTPCYPCHKLHFGRGTCPVTNLGTDESPVPAAACTAELDTDKIYKAVRDCLRMRMVA